MCFCASWSLLFYCHHIMRTQSPHSPTMRSSSRRRVPSPANSTFSGISSYRTDSYRPLRDRSLNSSATVDSYQVACAHYDELSRYLVTYLAKGSISPSISTHLISRSSLSSLQNRQIPAQRHARNSPSLLPGSSKSYLQMSMMN